VIIRAATAADCADLAAADSRSNPSPWSENQFRSALDERFTTVLIAECGGKTAGFIVWQSVCGESELHLVATDPPYRRQGVAAQLLAQWFQTAFSEHAERLFLEVRAGNSAAQNLYRKFGFAECGRRKNYYPLPEGGYEDAVLMTHGPSDSETAEIPKP
jgi:ribosomal-protein-alanine acetyltransferase